MEVSTSGLDIPTSGPMSFFNCATVACKFVITSFCFWICFSRSVTRGFDLERDPDLERDRDLEREQDLECERGLLVCVLDFRIKLISFSKFS